MLSSFGCQSLFLVKGNMKKGPFFYSCKGIYKTYRLYPDTSSAFVSSTVPLAGDRNKWVSTPSPQCYHWILSFLSSYECINATAYGSGHLCIAVPSRLYFVPSKEYPLAGMRLSVKDIFHLQGVVTTCGNRAYADLCGMQYANSAAVQDAIDKGAIIVGKTKTAEFTGSQEVDGDWTDYACPKNPRADGYLRSSGSSTGSAASVASYPWLDGSLGSDGMLSTFSDSSPTRLISTAAGGSIRDPAVVHGVLGLRPSHDGSSEPNTSMPCP